VGSGQMGRSLQHLAVDGDRSARSEPVPGGLAPARGVGADRPVEGVTNDSCQHPADHGTSHTDGRGNKTTYAYNTSNQLTTTTDPLGGATVYTYTTLGAIQTVKTPRGKVTTYGYDTAGNRTSVTTPLGEKATFTYDAAGRILTKTDPRGNVPSATTTPDR
jgi:YD repeat-containing protein